MMKKIVKYLCFTSGIALLAAALSLAFYNINQDRKSGETARTIVDRLITEIPEPTQPSTTIITREDYDIIAEYEQSESNEDIENDIPSTEIDGSYYMGIIIIPSLNLELPIQKNWSYPSLQNSPCRYKGTIEDRNIIIAAHNYRSHFGRIGNLNTDDEIIIRDVLGNIHEYKVESIEHIRGTDIERMDFGSEEDWDLTLFTCTLDGQSRVTVRAYISDSEERGTGYEK